VGADFDLPEEIVSLAPVRKHINLFTHFNVARDGYPNLCHYTGWVGLRCGKAPANRQDLPGESIDISIAQVLGGGSRFRSLDVAATGDSRDSYSFRGANAVSPPEVSAGDFYRRIFGGDFQDPNSPNFAPNPRIMAEHSVLSAVAEQRSILQRQLGTADRARLDSYFTSLREIERQVALQLEKPEPMPSCKVGGSAPREMPVGLESELVASRHRLMTDIMVMALACNQTRVANLVYSSSQALTVKKGYEKAHHTVTHEELVDEKLGYQPLTSWFTRRAMEQWAYFVAALAKVPEGDGTLLDNMLVYAHSDQAYAKIHTLEGIPMFTAGRAGGRLKTGLHITGNGDPATRLGYTLQRILGLDIASWGEGSNRTTKEIGEILA
jgi:hypothetical protein